MKRGTPRSYPSGYSKRKRKEKQEKVVKEQFAGSMRKYLTSQSNPDQSSSTSSLLTSIGQDEPAVSTSAQVADSSSIQSTTPVCENSSQLTDVTSSIPSGIKISSKTNLLIPTTSTQSEVVSSIISQPDFTAPGTSIQPDVPTSEYIVSQVRLSFDDDSADISPMKNVEEDNQIPQIADVYSLVSTSSPTQDNRTQIEREFNIAKLPTALHPADMDLSKLTYVPV